MKRNIYYLLISFTFFIFLQTHLTASIFDHLNKQSDALIFKKKISKSEIDKYLYIYAPSTVQMGAVENFGYYIGYAKKTKSRNFKGKIYFFGNYDLNERENINGKPLYDCIFKSKEDKDSKNFISETGVVNIKCGKKLATYNGNYVKNGLKNGTASLFLEKLDPDYPFYFPNELNISFFPTLNELNEKKNIFLLSKLNKNNKNQKEIFELRKQIDELIKLSNDSNSLELKKNIAILERDIKELELMAASPSDQNLKKNNDVKLTEKNSATIKVGKDEKIFTASAYNWLTDKYFYAESNSNQNDAETKALKLCKNNSCIIRSENKINSELIAKKKEKKVDEKIINLESKVEIAKVTEPKQEEFKPKTKDVDNEPPVIEIAEQITVNKPDYEIEGKVLDSSDKIFIEIDGITSEVVGKKFKIKRYSPVDQQIKIVAIDKYGNRSKEKIINIKVDVKNTKVVALEPLNPLKVKSEINSSSVALIIGIEKYENTPAAKYASLDAKYFTEYSKNIFGVSTKNIKLLTDEQANLSNTNSAIFKWLPSKIKKNQTDLIIFYSGHGLASSDGKSKYILPSNVDPDLLSRTALSRNEFFDQIISLKPKSVTIFFDTCYSGVSRDEEMLLASAKPLMIVAEEENELPENFTIFTASKPDQISSGLKEAKHGIFSYYLMKGLEGNADINKDLKITNGELLAYMDLNVSEKALDLGRQQNPLLFGNESKVILTLN